MRNKRKLPATAYDEDSTSVSNEEDMFQEDITDDDDDQPCTSTQAIKRENDRKRLQEKRKSAKEKKKHESERKRLSLENETCEEKVFRNKNDRLQKEEEKLNETRQQRGHRSAKRRKIDEKREADRKSGRG